MARLTQSERELRYFKENWPPEKPKIAPPPVKPPKSPTVRCIVNGRTCDFQTAQPKPPDNVVDWPENEKRNEGMLL